MKHRPTYQVVVYRDGREIIRTATDSNIHRIWRQMDHVWSVIKRDSIRIAAKRGFF